MADASSLEKRVGIALQIARQRKDLVGTIFGDVHDQIQRLQKYEDRTTCYRMHHSIVGFLHQMGCSEFDPEHIAELEHATYKDVSDIADLEDENNYNPGIIECGYYRIYNSKTVRISRDEYFRCKREQESIIQGTHPIYNPGNYSARLLKIFVEVTAALSPKIELPKLVE